MLHVPTTPENLSSEDDHEDDEEKLNVEPGEGSIEELLQLPSKKAKTSRVQDLAQMH